MTDRTKEILRDGFGSLVNNAACIRGAKHGPLWLTIVMFVLSLLLPVIPLFVSQANVQGSSFLGSYSYGLEKHVTSMAIALKERNVKFTVGEDHLLSVTQDGVAINYPEYGANKPFEAYIDTGFDDNDGTKQQYGFVLYVSELKTAADRKAIINTISSQKYQLNTITPVENDVKENIYIPSYMVLFPNALYVVIYGNDSNTVKATSYLGDYKTIKATDNALDFLLTVTDKEGNNVSQDITNPTYTNGVLKNYKKILNKSYETLKIKNMWGTSGIYLGIFTGMSLVMGFLMWILTRGKNNPNNYYTPWLTAKIEARLGLSPALITLVVGFFLTSYVPLIYIGTLGLRIMWTSMKELRPVVQ